MIYTEINFMCNTEKLSSMVLKQGLGHNLETGCPKLAIV